MMNRFRIPHPVLQIRIGGRMVLIVALTLLPIISFSQTYLGAGYAEFIGESTFDDNAGIIITVQREFALNKISTRLRINPTLHTSLLYQELDDDFFPHYGSILALTPLISYDILRFRAFSLTPMVGPFVAWRVSLQQDNIILFGEQISEFHGGLEIGLAATITITEKFGIKIIPISAQFGGITYSQGTLATVMVRL